MKSREINILGLDPGFGRVGYAILTGTSDKPILKTFGCIETSSQQALVARLSAIKQAVSELIIKHQPTLVAMEKLFFSKNTKTALAVGEARGVLLVTVTEALVPIAEFTPPQVKLAVTGDGKADKKQIQKMLQMIFHLPKPIKSDDAADAVAIALCALSHKTINL